MGHHYFTEIVTVLLQTLSKNVSPKLTWKIVHRHGKTLYGVYELQVLKHLALSRQECYQKLFFWGVFKFTEPFAANVAIIYMLHL